MQQGERYIRVVEGELMVAEAYRQDANQRLRQFRDDLLRIQVEQAILERPQNIIGTIWLDD